MFNRHGGQMLCKDNQLVYFLLSRQYPNRLKGNYLLNADKSDCYLISISKKYRTNVPVFCL